MKSAVRISVSASIPQAIGLNNNQPVKLSYNFARNILLEYKIIVFFVVIFNRWCRIDGRFKVIFNMFATRRE